MKLQQWRITRSYPHTSELLILFQSLIFAEEKKNGINCIEQTWSPVGTTAPCRYLPAPQGFSSQERILGATAGDGAAAWCQLQQKAFEMWVFGLKQCNVELSSHSHPNKFRHKILRFPISNIWITPLAHCKLPICTLSQRFGMDRYGRCGSITKWLKWWEVISVQDKFSCTSMEWKRVFYTKNC